MKSSFCKFVDDTKLGEVFDTLEGKVTIQMHYNVLEKKWTNRDFI